MNLETLYPTVEIPAVDISRTVLLSGTTFMAIHEFDILMQDAQFFNPGKIGDRFWFVPANAKGQKFLGEVRSMRGDTRTRILHFEVNDLTPFLPYLSA